MIILNMMKLLDYIHFLMYKNTMHYSASKYISYWLVFYIGIIYWILVLIVGIKALGGIYSLIGFGVLSLIEIIGMTWVYDTKDRQSDAIARYHDNHPSRSKMIFHLILFFILPFAIGALLLLVTKLVGDNGGSLIKIIFD